MKKRIFKKRNSMAFKNILKKYKNSKEDIKLLKLLKAVPYPHKGPLAVLIRELELIKEIIEATPQDRKINDPNSNLKKYCPYALTCLSIFHEIDENSFEDDDPDDLTTEFEFIAYRLVLKDYPIQDLYKRIFL